MSINIHCDTITSATAAPLQIKSAVTVTGDLTATGALSERGRSVPIGEWQAYTPIWSGDGQGTAPTLGNSQLIGRYTLIGKTCSFTIQLTIGSTATFGAGTNYTLTLPLMAYVGTAQAFPGYINSAALSGRRFLVAGTLNTATRLALMVDNSQAAWQPANPAAAAANDVVEVSGTYEII